MALKRITAESGHPEKYNTTITYALAFLVAERIAGHDAGSWNEFADRNPDLLEWPNPVLTQLHPNGVLFTPPARRSFMLPTPS